MMDEEILISWDYTERLMGEAKHRHLNWEDYPNEYEEQPSEDFAFNELASDPSFSEEEWLDFVEQLDEIIKDRNPEGYWHAEVKNFGWRNQKGESEFFADTATELIRRVLPRIDCTFKVYPHGDHGIKIQNWHHDSPTGNEWYYLERAKNPDEGQ